MKLAELKKDPCWKGYKQVGTKRKHGKTVPNCVPESLSEAVKSELSTSDIEFIVRAASTGSRIMADKKILYRGVSSIMFNSPAAKALWKTEGKAFKQALKGNFSHIQIFDFDEKKQQTHWVPGEDFKLRKDT